MINNCAECGSPARTETRFPVPYVIAFRVICSSLDCENVGPTENDDLLAIERWNAENNEQK